MHLTLKQLRIFEAVADHRSYTRASEALHLSQPAVSMQIKQLEEQIALPLFERTGKEMRLTEAGRELLHYSRRIHEHLDELELVLDELKGLERGQLHLTVASTANYFAPQLLASFCQRYPGAQVSLDVTNRAGLLAALEANATDMAIMGRPPARRGLMGTPFMDNPLVVIAPPDHPFAGRTRIPLDELRGEPFIMRERDSGTRIAAERFLARHDIELRVSMEMSRSEAIKQAVEAGLGLGVVSLHTLEMELSLGRLVVLDVEDFPIMRRWYLVHRRGKRMAAMARAFERFVVDEADRVLAHLPRMEG